MLASQLPDWLSKPVIERINALEIFKGAAHGINHCLVNEYLPGQGILPHEDGAAYHPVTATVSLGGTIVLEVTTKPDEDNESQRSQGMQSWRIVQEPRSLLVTSGDAYSNTLHGIAEVEIDRDLDASTVANWNLLGNNATIQEADSCSHRTTRISLTLRDVKKVSTLGSRLLGRSRP